MGEFPSLPEILRVFQRAPGKTFRLRELVVELGLRSSQARELKSVLKDLARHRRIVYLKKNHFALAGKEKTARECLTHPSGGKVSGLRAIENRQSKIVNVSPASPSSRLSWTSGTAPNAAWRSKSSG